jgi:hypothetical protein
MTTYVFRNNKLVVKRKIRPNFPSDFTQFPTPSISRIEAYESPVTGETISSWRQRDADMTAVGAVDPRDLSGIPFQKRAEQNARQRQSDDDTLQWGAKSSD